MDTVSQISLISNIFNNLGYPENYPAYLNCKWEIKATPGKKIVASFREAHL